MLIPPITRKYCAMHETETPDRFLEAAAELLKESGGRADRLDSLLDRILAQLGCTTGTIHLLEPHSRLLKLAAHRGIPDVVGKIESIPVGKGMAGLAAERAEPVQICNLQSDNSGVVRPGARASKMRGSVAVPMIAAGTVRGALGVAKPVAYEFSRAECDLLLRIGALIAGHLAL